MQHRVLNSIQAHARPVPQAKADSDDGQARPFRIAGQRAGELPAGIPAQTAAVRRALESCLPAYQLRLGSHSAAALPQRPRQTVTHRGSAPLRVCPGLRFENLKLMLGHDHSVLVIVPLTMTSGLRPGPRPQGRGRRRRC